MKTLKDNFPEFHCQMNNFMIIRWLFTIDSIENLLYFVQGRKERNQFRENAENVDILVRPGRFRLRVVERQHFWSLGKARRDRGWTICPVRDERPR